MAMRLDEIVRHQATDEPTGMRLGDVFSLERTETPELNEISLFQVSEEQTEQWKAEGKIGYFEQANRQDLTEMIPFNPESAVKSVRLLNAVNRLKRDKYEDSPEQRNLDVEHVNKFLMKLEEERIRGYTIGGRIIQGAAALPAFMVEFLLTGGMAAIGKKAVAKSIKPVVKQIVKRQALKFTTRVAGGVAGAVMRTAAMPHRVVRSYAERQLNASLELTEKGLQIAEQSREKPFTSAMKAYGDVVIENFSEVTGPSLGKAAGRVVPRKMARGLLKLFKKLHPNKSTRVLFTKLGYHGFLEELGEERVGALLRAVTGVENFGADNPDSMFDRIVASIPNGEEMLVEAGVLALPGAIHAGTQQTMRIIRGRKVTTKPGEVIVDKETGEPTEIGGFEEEISDKTVEEILRATKAPIEPAEELPVRAVEPEAPKAELPEKVVPEAIVRKLTPEEIEARRKAPPVKKILGVEPAEFIRARETTLLKRRIQDIARGARMGTISTKQQIKQAQTDLIETIEKSGIEAKDRAKFIRAIKNTQTGAQLSKVLPEIEQKLTTLKETSESKGLRAKMAKQLKTTRPKKVAGKPVGKFTPEVQSVLDKARMASKLTSEQVQEKIAANLEILGNEIPTVEQALENRILSLFGGFKDKSSAELRESSKVLQDLVEKGRSENLARLQERKERRAEDRERSLKSIIGKRTPSTSRIKSPIDTLRKTLSEPFKTFLGWDNILDVLSRDDTTQAGQSDLSRIAKVSTQETAEKGVRRRNIERVLEIAIKAFDLKTNAQLVKRFRQDSKIQNLGVFKNNRGEETTFELSKAEARKLWMELQDPSLVETLTSEKGNAYSPDMIQAVEDFLTQEDRVFAEAQLRFYTEFYNNVVNPVYSDIYGVNLPFNEFYSPISREHKIKKLTDEFLKEMGFRRSVTTGSLKSRVANLNPLKVRSDITTLQKHIIEMAHFVTWADKIRQLNSIFTNNEIRDVIGKKYGGEMLRVINDFIKDFTTGRIDQSKNFGFWDGLRVNFTRSVLAVKANLFFKQMVSFVAFADAIPITSFVKGVSDFMVDPIGKTRILNQSEVMKARGANLTRDIRDAMASDEFSTFRQKPSFRNMLMFTTKLGDRGAILLGGWSIYKYTLDKTSDSAKAMQAFEEITSATQQSADLSQLSVWQRGNTFMKMFTMFTSSQNQYFRKEYMAIRNLIARRTTVRKVAKTILIFHFILPMFFQWVSDFGKWNKGEQLRAAILGSFNGIFIIKDILDSIIRQLLGLKRFKTTLPILSIPSGIHKAMSLFDIDDILFEDVMFALRTLSESVGQVTGMPFRQIGDWIEGIKDIQEGEKARGILKFLGWTNYVIDNNLE